MRTRRAFTLIELLVVIAVIALLMAILLPALQRVRKQAKGVACRARLRNWAIVMKFYTNDYDGQFWHVASPWFPDDSRRPAQGLWFNTLEPYFGADNRELLLCPLAQRRTREFEWYRDYGGTFLPWVFHGGPPYGLLGSYGVSDLVQQRLERDTDLQRGVNRQVWGTCLVREAANVPVLLDCVAWSVLVVDEYSTPPPETEPPAYEPAFKEAGPRGILGYDKIGGVCLNRHEGGVNCLFADWSVRKVGIKEIWTLKWSRQFDTQGRWTKAGGVQPEDWPQWMRRFKDY